MPRARAARSGHAGVRGALFRLRPGPGSEPRRVAVPTYSGRAARELSPPSPESRHVNMLHALHSAHVLRAFEGAGIRTPQLAHAAPHLGNGFIFVFFHPVA